jgi:hypothetical protein
MASHIEVSFVYGDLFIEGLDKQALGLVDWCRSGVLGAIFVMACIFILLAVLQLRLILPDPLPGAKRSSAEKKARWRGWWRHLVTKSGGNFVTRLSSILPDAFMRCFFWALIPKHFHRCCRQRCLYKGSVTLKSVSTSPIISDRYAR